MYLSGTVRTILERMWQSLTIPNLGRGGYIFPLKSTGDFRRTTFLLSLSLISFASAAQIQSNGSGGGNWNNGGTWQGGVVPTTGNDVIILDGDLVSLNGDRTIQNLTINSGGTLRQNNNRELTLTGNLTNNGTFTSNETGGDVDVIMMTGLNAVLDGAGTFDMNENGRFEFQANTTIAASADLYFYASGAQEQLVRIDNNVTVTNNGSIRVEEDIIGGNGSSTWINAANATLIIGDDLLNTGVLTASAVGNTVEYDESEDVNVKTPTGNQYYNLTASGSQVKTIQANLTILNDLTISSTLASGNNDLIVQGDWTNTGNFTEGTGTVTLNATTDQTITTSVVEQFNNLTIDKAGSQLILQSDVQISGTLDMDNVIINTGSNTLILGTGTGQTGTLNSTTNATVVGSFKRWVNATATPFLFPLGTSTDHRPANISFDDLTGGTVTGVFVTSSPGSLTNPPLDDSGFSLNNLHLNGYWSFTKGDGLATTSYDVDLTATNFTTFALSSNSRIVSRRNATSDWEIDGTHDGASFSGSTIHRDNLGTLSAHYAVAENNSCSYPSTSAMTGATGICINTTGEVYSVTGTLGSTFSWEVVGGTIVGGTGTGTTVDPSVRSAANLTSVTVDWGNNGGIGYVQVIEDNSGAGGCGAGDPVVSAVTIHPVPTSEITGSATVTINTTGEPYNITNTTGYTYNWSVTGGGNTIASGQTTDAITLDWGATPGTYTLSVIGEEGTVCSPAQQAAQVDLTVTLVDVILSNGTGGGNANNGGSWQGGVVPGPGDNVRILSGDIIRLNGDRTINSLEIESGATVIQNNNQELTLTGNLTNNGTFTSNETDGDNDVIMMVGTSGILDGTGTFNMGDDGRLELQTSITIPSTADLIFTGTQEDQVRLDNDIVVTNYGSISISQDLTGGNGNSTWINAAGSNLEVGDELLNTGTLYANADGNTVNYIGIDNNDEVKIPVNNQYYNLSITGSQVKSLLADMTLLGDLTISSNLNTDDFDLIIYGDWNNTGTFQSTNGTVTFTGTNTQNLTTTIGETFNNLIISKGGGTLNASGDVQVNNTLEIDNCFIDMGSSTLTLGSSTAAVGTLIRSAPASIAGKFERWINSTGTAILFPLGTANDYNAVEITFNNLTNGSLIGEFVDSNPGTINNPPLDDAGVGINNTYLAGYWSLERANSLTSNDYDLSLRGEGFNSFTVSNNTRVLVRTSSGADWEVNGSHVSAPFTFPIAARDNMDVLSGEFTLGENNSCSFPATSAISGTTDQCINNTGEAYSVTGTAGSTFSWEVVGGTIVGGTGTGTDADPSVRSGIDLTAITVDWGATGGTAAVRVTEDNAAVGGCGLGEQVVLDVNLNPVPTSAITGSVFVPASATGVSYEVSNSTGYAYNWTVSGGGNAIASGNGTNSITIDWGATIGDFTVSVTADESTVCSPAESAAQVDLTVTVVDVIESNGTGGGNWNNGGTWVGGIVPAAGTNVRIVTGDNVRLNGDRTINSLEIQSGATLTQNNNQELTLTGDLTNNGTFVSNETDGDNDVIMMSGTNAILDGTGDFNMGDDGRLEFLNTTTIGANAVLTFFGTQESQIRIDDDIVITNNGSISISQDLTGGNGNSTWINAAGSTLEVGDELLNTGVLVANATGNTVNYIGVDNNDDIKITSTGEYYNLQITGSQVKSMLADLIVLGDLTISSNLDPAGFTLTVRGDWTNTGTFQEGTSTVVFDGTTDQTLTSATDEIFNNLTVSKSGSTLILMANVGVNQTLDMNNCLIDAQSNVLTLGSGVSQLGTLVRTAPATIIGKFERWVNAANQTNLLFPVGTATAYNPINVTFNNLNPGSLIGEFIDANPGNFASPPLNDSGYDLNNTYNNGYWGLTRANSLSSSDYDLQLTGNNFDAFTPSSNTRVVSRLNNTSNWTVNGTHNGGAFVSPTVSRDNLSLLSAEYTWAENDACSYPTTTAVVGDASVCLNETGVAYSTSGTVGSTYTWTVTGGTIVGSNSGIDLTAITVDWGTSGGAGQVEVVEDNTASGGCGTGTPVTLDVIINPVVTSAISGATTVGINQVGEIYSVTANAGYTYDWDIAGGTITTPADPDNDVTGTITVDWGAVASTGQLTVTATEGSECAPPVAAAAVTLDVSILDVIESNGTGGGNWNNGGSWVGGIVPGPTNSARIVSGDVITLNGDRTIIGLEIQSGATLRQNNNQELTLTGNLTNNGTFTSRETDGDNDVIMMTGTNAILDGTGTFDMDIDGRLEFLNTTTIAASADLSFTGTQESQIRIDDDIVITNNGAISISQDLTGGNANSTWINAVGATLAVGDELLNTGILVANADGNTVNYNGIDNNDDIKEPTSGEYYHLQITGGQVKDMISNLTVLGDLTITSTLNADTYTLAVGGDWSNAGNFTEATSTVQFIGSGAQAFTTSTAEEFYNLTLNKTGGVLTSSNNINVSNTLSLDAGAIDMGTSTLTLGTSTANLGALTHTAPARIVGEFQRWVNTGNQTNLELPLGSVNDQAEAILTFNNLTAGSIITEFVATDPGNNGLSLDDAGTIVYNNFYEGYWRFTAANGFLTSDYDANLDANSFSSFDVSTSRVLTRPNSSSAWTGDGTHVAAVSGVANRDNVTTFSAELGLGDVNNCPAPATSSITGDDNVCINEAAVAYTAVGGLAGSTYTWTVVGGTIDGGVSTGVGLTSINVTWGVTGGTGSVTVVENNSFSPVFGCGAGSPITLDVTINPVATSAITGNTFAIIDQTGITYTVTANAGYTYDWDITGGTITAPADPDNDVTGSITVTWGSTAGTETITVTATENTQCAAPESAAAVTLDVTVLDVIESNGTGGGNWNNGGTWIGGIVPTTGNNARIVTGDVVRLNGDRTINSLEIQSGATLIQNNNQELTLTGNLTHNGTFTSLETDGDNDVIMMTGANGILDGTGTFDMGDDGRLEILSTTSVSASAALTFIGTQESQVRIDNDIVVTNNGSISISQDLTGGNANSTWINAAGSYLSCGDELLNNGVLIANADGNTVNYTGVDNDDDIKEPSGGEYFNLQLTGAQVKNAISNLSILGDITISSTFDANTFTIDVAGDWTSTGAFIPATSTINFNGGADQTITSSGGETFTNLNITKTSGTLNLASNVDVTGTLTMNEGNVDVQANQLTLGTSAITEGTLTHTSGSIIGAFDRWVNSASSFLFPVGTATDYRPATISFDGLSAGGRLRTSFVESGPGTQGLPFDDGGYMVENTFTEGYWSVTTPVGVTFTTYDIDLTGNGFVSFTVDSDTRAVSRTNSSSDWLGNGTHVAATGATAQRDDLATLPLEFAFGDDTPCSPPSTSAITRVVAGDNCANQSGVVYEVTNTPGSTYSWAVNGGTITAGQGTNSITVDWGATGGVYSISVTEDNSASGGCGVGTPVTLGEDVHPLTTSAISGSISSAAGTTGVSYSVTSQTGYTYDWAIDDEVNNTLTEDGSSVATIDWGSIFTDFVVTVTATHTNCALSPDPVTLDVEVYEVIESNGTGGGNWNNGATWVGGGVPQPTNSVRIVGNDVVTLNGDRTIDNIIITSNATLSQNNNQELTITGNFTNDGTFTSNETDGVQDVIMMTGAGAVLDGSGTFDMGNDGRMEFQATTSIAATADLTYTGAEDQQLRLDNDVIVTNNGRITIGRDLRGGNANSTWVNAAGAYLSVGDDMLQTGNLNANAIGNTVEYTSANGADIKVPANAEYYHFIMSGTGKTQTADLIMLGDFTVSGTHTTSNRDLTIAGNWTNTGTFNEGTGVVTLNGTTDQSITNAAGETFYDVVINKSGGNVVLVNNIEVTNSLNLQQGLVDAETNGATLTLGTSGPTSGTLSRSSGYVVGNFRRWIPAASTGVEFIFPVGVTTDYRPLDVTFDAITTGGSVIAYFDATAPGNGTTLPIVDGAQTVSNAFTEGFWTVQASDGFATTQYDVDLTGNGFTSFAFDAGGETRVLVRSNGATDWISGIPGTHVNGSGSEVQRDDVTTALDIDLAVGDITGCPTINTSVITGNVEVCTSATGEVYSVVNTPGSTYTWSVTGGSITSGVGTNSITVTWDAIGGERVVEVTEDNGCAVGTPVSLDVNVNPIPAGSVSGNFGVAEGALGEVYTIFNRTGYSYLWSTADGTIVGSAINPNVTIDWTGTGTGTLTLTVTYDDAIAVCGAPTADEVINESITFYSEFETTNSGNFNTAGTWVCNCIPPPNSNIVIRNTHTLTLDAATNVQDLTIDNGATLDNNNFVLTVNGNYTNNGDHTSSNSTNINFAGVTLDGDGNVTGDLFRIQATSSTAGAANLNFTAPTSIASGVVFTNNGDLSFNNDVTGAASTATIINNAGATINISTANFLNTGSIQANMVGNLVNYSNSGDQNIKSPGGSPAEYYDLQTLGSGNKNLSGNLGIGNDLTISGGTLVANNHTISLGGDWSNNSLFDEGTGRVVFEGSTAQEISNSSGTETFYSVTIDNAHAGNGVAPATGTDIEISNQLLLTDGLITPNASDQLIMGANATIIGGSASSYVNGPLTHTMATFSTITKNYPLGNGAGFKRVEVALTQDAATSTTYTMDYTAANVNFLAVSTNQPLPDAIADIKDLSIQGYWEMNQGAGANLLNADMTFYYTAIDGVADFANLIIAKADDETAGSTWAKVAEGGTGNISGTIAATGITSFSIFSLGNNLAGTNPLPVELIEFSGQQAEDDVVLSWSTATETDNDYFILQHSTDLEHFEELAVIQGAGDSKEELHYGFTHRDPVAGVNYYRLVQVDFDGTESIAEAISVVFNLEEVELLFEVFPNPAHELVNVLMRGLAPGQRTSIQFIGPNGNILRNALGEADSSGSLEHQIGDLQLLPSGTYLVLVTANGQQPLFKRVVIH